MSDSSLRDEELGTCSAADILFSDCVKMQKFSSAVSIAPAVSSMGALMTLKTKVVYALANMEEVFALTFSILKRVLNGLG